MRLRDSIIWPFLGAVLVILGFLAFVLQQSRGDDFSDKIAQLKAKTVAKAKKVDPFVASNKAETTSSGPKIGDQKITDDPNRPWTYGWGREYGWNELGWYRPLATVVVLSCVGGCPAGCNCPGTAGGPCSCAQPAMYQQVPYYQPARSFRSYGRSCSTSS